MNRFPIIFLLLIVCPVVVFGFDGPTMGWSSWNTYRVNINDSLIRRQADALVRSGLKDAGYNHVNIDDGFFGGRDEATGELKYHPVRFPSGLKGTVDYVHSLGLRAGIYSDAGANTCGCYWDNDTIARNVGLLGHETRDARLFFKDIGFDFIKIDYCGADGNQNEQLYYYEPEQRYKAIAEASPLPVILYNVPGRTGVNMTAETTLRLARDFENIIGIKEASGNFSQIDDIIKNKPDDFIVLSGDDGITYPLIALGAVGVISVIGNAFPREFSRMVRLALEGDYPRALTIHHRFTELFSLLFVDGNPAGVKCLLHAMGYIENELRLPLVPTRITTYEKIRQVLERLG